MANVRLIDMGALWLEPEEANVTQACKVKIVNGDIILEKRDPARVVKSQQGAGLLSEGATSAISALFYAQRVQAAAINDWRALRDKILRESGRDPSIFYPSNIAVEPIKQEVIAMPIDNTSDRPPRFR